MIKTLLGKESFSIKNFSDIFTYGLDQWSKKNRKGGPVGSQLFPITRNKEQI